MINTYLKLGWHLLPIKPGTKMPLDGQGLKHATLDKKTVAAWRRKGCDWAIACTTSGVVVLDVDKRHGGLVAWEDLVRELGPLPPHPIQRTRNGGYHHVFHDPGPCKGKLAAGVDIKRRGYILVAPSEGYSWDSEPREPPDLPGAWLDEVLKDRPQPRPPAPRSAPSGCGSNYGIRALEDECHAVATEPDGNRNNRLNEAALKLGALVAGGELDGVAARERLLDAALSSGLPEREATATIASGWKAGTGQPRTRPETPKRPVDEPPPPDDDDRPDDLTMSRLKRHIEGDPAWRQGITFRALASGEEVVERTAANLALLLTHTDDWRGCLRWDELNYTACWVKAPPPIPGLATPAGALRDEHYTWVQHAARRSFGVSWPKTSVEDAVLLAALANPHHPVRDYLESLEWDGTARLFNWLGRYLGATEGTYAQQAGYWWAISAVARAMRPSCQADHVVVLQGPQGCGKSSAIKLLAGDWYSGNLGNLRDKDGAQTLVGAWIVEIGELDALRGMNATRVKDFISLRVDRYRPSFGRNVVTRPRMCVFVGTTNESEFLTDPTGARRFWPVRVTGLDREALRQDRDQLWAEALVAHEDGERWWPEGQNEVAALANAAEARQQRDPWEDVLIPWLAARAATGDELTMATALEACGVEKGRMTAKEAARAASILRRAGWERRHTRDGKRWTVGERAQRLLTLA